VWLSHPVGCRPNCKGDYTVFGSNQLYTKAKTYNIDFRNMELSEYWAFGIGLLNLPNIEQLPKRSKSLLWPGELSLPLKLYVGFWARSSYFTFQGSLRRSCWKISFASYCRFNFYSRSLPVPTVPLTVFTCVTV